MASDYGLTVGRLLAAAHRSGLDSGAFDAVVADALDEICGPDAAPEVRQRAHLVLVTLTGLTVAAARAAAAATGQDTDALLVQLPGVALTGLL